MVNSQGNDWKSMFIRVIQVTGMEYFHEKKLNVMAWSECFVCYRLNKKIDGTILFHVLMSSHFCHFSSWDGMRTHKHDKPM